MKIGVVGVDIMKVMEELAKTKALFRDEKDFRVNLGRMLARLYPDSAQMQYDVSSFYPSDERVDIMTTYKGMTIGIELKYKWVAMGNIRPFVYDGNEFWPPKYGQPDDVTRFKFLEDIQKLESIAMNRSDIVGYAILLTNKQGLWNPPRKRKPNDLMFRIHEERDTIHGKLKWVGRPAEATLEATGNSITIRDKYPIHWHGYMEIPKVDNGLFRHLIIKVK